MTSIAGPRPATIEAALNALEQAQDSLLGLGNLSESLFNFTTLRDDDGTAPAHAGTPWGVKASQGSRPNMEDAYSAVQMPQSAPIPSLGSGQQEPDTRGVPSDEANGTHGDVSIAPSAPAQEPVACLPEDLAVLSVFDGHGGTEVAEHCRDRLHRHFAASLSRSRAAAQGQDSDDGEASQVDTASWCPAHAEGSNSTLSCKGCASQHVSDALRAAFLKTDTELAGTEAGEFVGATAVVAVVGKDNIWIAHCGDSRAVIQRNGEAIALTKDHKPDREDEAARIKAAGGRIVFSSGSHRVMGMLAMSRAIGDHFLRPYVIADPEVACVERTHQDEVLVLATDGLWDVFSCKEATTLAQRCISRSKERGMSRHGACRVAANVLTKVALERGSRDNITVIVVDVSPTTQHHHHHPHHHPHPAHPRAPSQPGGVAQDSNPGLSSHPPPALPGVADTCSSAATAASTTAQAHTGVPSEAASSGSRPTGASVTPLEPTNAFGTTFSKLQQLANAAAEGLPAPLPAPASASAAAQASSSAASTSSASGAADAAKALSNPGAKAPQPPAANWPQSDPNSEDGKAGAVAGGSAGSKAGAQGGMGSRTQSFSVTTCTWVKPSSSSSALSSLAGAGGSQVSLSTAGDRALDRQTSAPDQQRAGGRASATNVETTDGTQPPSQSAAPGAGAPPSPSPVLVPAVPRSTGGNVSPKPGGPMPQSRLGAIPPARAPGDGGSVLPQHNAVIRALKLEQQERAQQGAQARPPSGSSATAGLRSTGEGGLVSVAAPRNGSETGAVSGRKPRVVAKTVPRKGSNAAMETQAVAEPAAGAAAPLPGLAAVPTEGSLTLPACDKQSGDGSDTAAEGSSRAFKTL